MEASRMEAYMSEAQESRRALSLRDIAEDEVACERFRLRLDSYRNELKLLVSEMSGLLAVLNANACEAAEMNQEMRSIFGRLGYRSARARPAERPCSPGASALQR